MALKTNETKLEVNYDPLSSNFMLFGYMENIPGKRTPYITTVIYRDKYSITALLKVPLYQWLSILDGVRLF